MFGTQRRRVYNIMLFDGSINNHVVAKTEAVPKAPCSAGGSKTVSRYIVMFHEEMVLYITCYYSIPEAA